MSNCDFDKVALQILKTPFLKNREFLKRGFFRQLINTTFIYLLYSIMLLCLKNP